MDEKYIEMAGEISEAEIAAARDKITKRRQVKPDGFEGLCECGEVVPEQRIMLGFFNCVPCQELQERRGRFYKVE
jgi:RNA polymerase-binding transcription factor DksA